jgi:hypothetical protein
VGKLSEMPYVTEKTMTLAEFLKEYTWETSTKIDELKNIFDCTVFRRNNLTPLFRFTITLPNDELNDIDKFVITDKRDVNMQIAHYAKSILESWIENHP